VAVQEWKIDRLEYGHISLIAQTPVVGQFESGEGAGAVDRAKVDPKWSYSLLEQRVAWGARHWLTPHKLTGIADMNRFAGQKLAFIQDASHRNKTCGAD